LTNSGEDSFEVAKQAIAALNSRDVERYLALCHEDIELASPAAAIEGANVGEAGIRAFFAELEVATREFRLEVEAHREAGGGVVLVEATLTSTSERGVEIRQPLYNVYEVGGGKLRRVRGFFDRDEAMRAAGLS
jgi:ketosteroid isomerase-like protein